VLIRVIGAEREETGFPLGKSGTSDDPFIIDTGARASVRAVVAAAAQAAEGIAPTLP
jgi:hypothetical protein